MTSPRRMTSSHVNNLLIWIGSQPDPLAKVVEFVLNQHAMESLFSLLLMLSNNKKLSYNEIDALKSTLDSFLIVFLQHDQLSLNEAMITWVLERKIPISRLDISDQYSDGSCSTLIEYLRAHINSLQHLRIHGRHNDRVNIIDEILGVGNSEPPNVLKTLELTGYHRLSQNVLEILATRFTHLSKIDFSGCGRAIENKVLEAIARNYDALTEISVRGCIAVSDVGLLSLAKPGNLITFADFGLTSVTDDGILEFAKRCPNLLDLGSYSVDDDLIFKLCSSIGDDHPFSAIMVDGNKVQDNFSDDGLVLLSTPFGFLYHPPDGFDGLPDGYIGRPLLSKLRLHFCHGVSDSGLQSLAGGLAYASGGNLHYRGCIFLTHVTLNHCHSVSDDGIECVLQGCCFIRMLELIGCALISDESVKAMSRYGHNLTSVNLFACGRVGTEEVALAWFALCSPLQYINLVGTSVCDKAVELLLLNLKLKKPIDKRPLELCLELTRFGDIEWVHAPDFVKFSLHPFQLGDYPRDNANRP